MLRRAAAAISLAFVGCAAQPPAAEEPVPMPDRFAQSADLPRGTELRPRWWTLLDDPALASLIERAVQANVDVRIALERLVHARALVASARAGHLPSGGVSAGVERRQLSAFEAAPLPGPQKVTRHDAGFDASWELDLFGRISGQVDAASAGEAATAARLEDVRLSVAAEVARAWFELLGASERRMLALEALERQRGIARIVAARVKEGYAQLLDEKRSRADLHFVASELPSLDAEIVAAAARIAVLIGENPSTFTAPAVSHQAWRMQRLAIGDAADLLHTRPDLREAAARIDGSRATVSSIRAEFFPRLVVSGFLGFVSGHAAALGAAASESWAIAPRLGVPLFDFPRIQARLDAARSEERQALLEYRKRVLVAIEDVETSLARYRLGQEQLEALRRRSGEATDASQLARARYEAGRSDFLELLEAERTATEAQQDLSRSVQAQRVAVVSVFKAFGAGWESGR